MDFLVSAFVIAFLGSAGFIATLAVIGRHKNPPGDYLSILGTSASDRSRISCGGSRCIGRVLEPDDA